MDILVTVGMGAWPFDRLLRAIQPLCREHRVFAQTGTSKVQLPCASVAFVPYAELLDRIKRSEVVITHAGNTVRLVQRAGKVPIAVARTAAMGEMANDHQVEYLRHEEREGRVVPVWDLDLLPEIVAEHPAVEARLMRERPLREPAEPARLSLLLDTLWELVARNPFKDHPARRYAYAWEELSGREGRHLDVGCNTGEFLGALAETTRLECHGVDPHEGYLSELQRRYPRLPVCHISVGSPLPYPDGYFSSVSMLDVLEHCPVENDIFSEVRRVMEPGGRFVLTVPARHIFSFLDPDNVKFRAPRLHRFAYSWQFGSDVYHERFVDVSNGLMGDMSVGKREHTNYRRDWLVDRLAAHGFAITRESGANLFWRWFQVPSLFVPSRLRGPFERAIWLDGELFHRANLFLTAERV